MEVAKWNGGPPCGRTTICLALEIVRVEDEMDGSREPNCSSRPSGVKWPALWQRA